MSKQKRLGTKSEEKILEYWYEHYKLFDDTCKDEGGIRENECFACGSCIDIQRCHIIPHWCGGSGDSSNIHLLCAKCHVESEGIKPYWTWLNWKRKNEWDYAINHLQKKYISCGFSYDEFQKQNIDLDSYIKNFMSSLYW